MWSSYFENNALCLRCTDEYLDFTLTCFFQNLLGWFWTYFFLSFLSWLPSFNFCDECVISWETRKTINLTNYNLSCKKAIIRTFNRNRFANQIWISFYLCDCDQTLLAVCMTTAEHLRDMQSGVPNIETNITLSWHNNNNWNMV